MEHAPNPGRARITAAPPPPAQLREEELDMLAVFRLIRRRLWFIACVTIFLAAVQLPFVLDIQQTYTSQSRLLIHRPLTAELSGAGLESFGPLDLTTEVERLRAQKIAERIIADFGLDAVEEFNPPPVEPSFVSRQITALKGLLTGAPPTRPAVDATNVVVSNFLNRLSVSRSGTSNVIAVAFTSRDPNLSALIPNAIISAYLADIDGQIAAQFAAAKDWLAARIEVQRAKVEAAEADARLFRAQNNLGTTTLETEAVVNLSSINTRQAEIGRERMGLQSTLLAIEAAATQAEKTDLVESDRMTDLVTQLRAQQAELANMLQTYGNSYGFVVDKREAVAETEAAMLAEVDRLMQSLKTRVALLDQEQSSLETEAVTARNALTSMANAEAEFETLTDRVTQERTALTGLEEQQRTLQTESSLPRAEVEILSPAAVSNWPDGRSRTFYMAAGTFAALAAAITLAVIVELFDSSIRSQQQLAGIRGAVPAGLIPMFRRRRDKRLPDKILHQPSGSFLDAVRGVAMLLERDRHADVPRSILVTSAVPGEGKSVITTALAMHFASAGGSVLIVDADLRHGSIHAGFRARDEPGLANYLSGQTDLEATIQHDRATGIDFIARGRKTPTPYPDPKKIMAILELARNRYQTVIFDSPPVLATSETSRLAAMLDRSLMVVRWGKTSRRMVDLAVEKVRAGSGEEVLVAINQVVPRRQMLYGFRDSGVFASELRKYHIR